jgi:hypothetical protein
MCSLITCNQACNQMFVNGITVLKLTKINIQHLLEKSKQNRLFFTQLSPYLYYLVDFIHFKILSPQLKQSHLIMAF